MTHCRQCEYEGQPCRTCDRRAEQRADTWEPDYDGSLAAHAADRYEHNGIHGGRA